MWNEQNKAASIMDVLEGTVEEWYDQVDGLLKASDFIPGNYEYSINIAYANSGNFEEGGQTHLDISCDRFKLISLDNSYINLDMNIPITVPVTVLSNLFVFNDSLYNSSKLFSSIFPNSLSM